MIVSLFFCVFFFLLGMPQLWTLQLAAAGTALMLFGIVTRSLLPNQLEYTAPPPTTPYPILELKRISDEPKHPEMMERSPTIASSIKDAKTMELIEKQNESDLENSHLTPLLYHTFDYFVEDRESFKFTISRRIGHSATASVFNVIEWPSRVVKYQSNCFLLDIPIHPLEIDYWFLKALDGLGVAPRPLYLSPPVKYSQPVSTKTHFKMDRAELDECTQNPQSSIRFLVMEKISLPLTRLLSQVNRLDVPTALDVGIKMMKTIKRIHDAGIIHGDIHLGNVGFLDPLRTRIVFIDFGRSRFHSLGSTRKVREKFSLVSCVLSKYELEGYSSSFRDDVIRIIEVIALLMNGNTYIDYIEKLEAQPEELYKWKAAEFIFSFPESDVFMTYPPSVRQPLREHLGNVLRLGRGQNSPNTQKPPYDEILEALRTAKTAIANW